MRKGVAELLRGTVAREHGGNGEMDAEEVPPSLITQYLSLYFRCRRFKDMQLPSAGGILDQEEITMQIFEIIHGMVIDYEREQQEATMNKMQQQSRIANAKQVGKRGFRK